MSNIHGPAKFRRASDVVRDDHVVALQRIFSPVFYMTLDGYTTSPRRNARGERLWKVGPHELVESDVHDLAELEIAYRRERGAIELRPLSELIAELPAHHWMRALSSIKPIWSNEFSFRSTPKSRTLEAIVAHAMSAAEARELAHA